MKTYSESFDLEVSGKHLSVIATPYIVNSTNEKRFRVSYNGSPVHIFTWNEKEKRIHSIKDSVHPIPFQIEQAIARELENRQAA